MLFVCEHPFQLTSWPHTRTDAVLSTVPPSKSKDDDDLEFAWQWMELAKQIYENQAAKNVDGAKEKLAESLLCLGDIQLENGMLAKILGRLLVHPRWWNEASLLIPSPFPPRMI